MTLVTSHGDAAEVISLRLNDKAAQALGFPFGAVADLPVGAGDLGRRLTAGGLSRDERGGLFVPGLSFAVADYADLTHRECQRNSWHLDDLPDVRVEVDGDGAPHVTHEEQVHMLRHGIVLSRIVCDLADALPDRPPTCCIVATNDSSGTFRFHQVRPGESWIDDHLDNYFEDMIIVVENNHTDVEFRRMT